MKSYGGATVDPNVKINSVAFFANTAVYVVAAYISMIMHWNYST